MAAVAFLIENNSTVVKEIITPDLGPKMRNQIKLKETHERSLLFYPNISPIKIEGPTKQHPPKRPASR